MSHPPDDFIRFSDRGGAQELARIRSYVMPRLRCSRSARANRRRREFRNHLWQPTAADVEADLQTWRAVRGGVLPVSLEVGFGFGHHLMGLLKQDARRLYIGCEPSADLCAKVHAGIDVGDQDRLRMFPGDVRDLLDILPSACLSAVYVLFPDPWPKRRHHKRRLVNDGFLSQVVRAMHPRAELFLATDDADYCSWILASIRRQPALQWSNKNVHEWRKPWLPWFGTRYESRAHARGHVPIYLRAIRL